MTTKPKRIRRPAATERPDGADLIKVCARIAEDRKAEDIAVLDLRQFAYITDYFLIGSAGNARQMQAIAGAIQQEMHKLGARPIGVEGLGATESRWVLLDYGDFVAHIFDPEWRKLYDLELLWGDAPRLDWSVLKRRSRRKKPAGDASGA